MVRWDRVSGPDLANRPPQGSNLGRNRLFWAVKLIGSLMTAHQWCTSSLRWRYLSIKGNSRFLARRKGCCLVWRTERASGYCSNCILVPGERQDRLFRQIPDGWR